MTRRYHIDLSCPVCGGELVHQADGVIRSRSVNAVVRCQKCRRGQILVVRLIPAEDQP